MLDAYTSEQANGSSSPATLMRQDQHYLLYAVCSGFIAEA
jgi:hypothetical protein